MDWIPLMYFFKQSWIRSSSYTVRVNRMPELKSYSVQPVGFRKRAIKLNHIENDFSQLDGYYFQGIYLKHNTDWMSLMYFSINYTADDTLNSANRFQTLVLTVVSRFFEGFSFKNPTSFGF